VWDGGRRGAFFRSLFTWAHQREFIDTRISGRGLFVLPHGDFVGFCVDFPVAPEHRVQVLDRGKAYLAHVVELVGCQPLDEAVCDAYGWEYDVLADEEAILRRLLALNLERAARQSQG